MSGEYIIQRSTMLRGQGHYREAIACIEKNIDEVEQWLQSTAWQEAQFAAEAIGDSKLSARFAEKARTLEAAPRMISRPDAVTSVLYRWV